MTIFALCLLVALAAFLGGRIRRTPRSVGETAMTAHRCGASNPMNARYCRRCGETLMIDLVDESPRR